jgi:hypothetical protein
MRSTVPTPRYLAYGLVGILACRGIRFTVENALQYIAAGSFEFGQRSDHLLFHEGQEMIETQTPGLPAAPPLTKPSLPTNFMNCFEILNFSELGQPVNLFAIDLRTAHGTPRRIVAS